MVNVYEIIDTILYTLYNKGEVKRINQKEKLYGKGIWIL